MAASAHRALQLRPSLLRLTATLLGFIAMSLLSTCPVPSLLQTTNRKTQSRRTRQVMRLWTLRGGGIKGLGPLITKEAPQAVSEVSLESLQGKRVAIDASMCLYQFLIAIRAKGGNQGFTSSLASDSGEETSHLIGFFWRTIAFLKQGIRVLYVFDGKPPKLKMQELSQRAEKRKQAEIGLSDAKSQMDVDLANKLAKRTLKVTAQHVNDTKRLLAYMGVPFIEAPSEAEAQCAHLTKQGFVDATGTEDMDALCTGAPVLLRKMASSGDPKKASVVRIQLDKVLSGLNLTMPQFVDFCILCGCDYCPTIRGVGPKTALSGIRKHGSIESLIESMPRVEQPGHNDNATTALAGGNEETEGESENARKKKKAKAKSSQQRQQSLPEPFPYKEARSLLITPNVTDAKKVKEYVNWESPVYEEELTRFLVEEKGFSSKRVASGITSLKKAKLIEPQSSLLDFFKVAPITAEGEGGQKSPQPGSGSDGSSKKRART